MSDSDRLERLEQRVQRLEQLMRQVLHALPPRAGEAVAPPAAAPMSEAPPGAPPPLVRAPATPPPPERTARPALDGEQWVGQRGLLAVGVVAVVLAAGYLLKLSFDRGWISPLARCVGGVLAGAGIAAVGWRLERRGYRTYGPALIGAGAGVIYLAVWAASRLYGFLPPVPGILGMALVALGLAALAWATGVEALGAAAVAGAFLAPLVVGQVEHDADRLLVYLAAMGWAMGIVVRQNGWRLTALLLGAGFFGLGVPAAHSATPLLAIAFGALGGAGGLWLGLERNWWETRFLAFWGGWGCLMAASDPDTAWLVLGAGAVLSAPVWRRGWRQGSWPFVAGERGWRAFFPSLYFYVTPLLLTWAVAALPVEAITHHVGYAFGVVAAGYLLAGVGPERRGFALVATVIAALGVLAEWDVRVTSAGVFGVLAVLWGGVGLATRRDDWNLHAFGTLVVGLVALWTGAADRRPYDEPAFLGTWALVATGLLAVCVGLATALAAPDPETRRWRPAALWGAAGLQLLFGVTGELPRWFRLHLADPAGARLAGGLSVSAWWLLFAAASVLVGFRRELRPLRLAGLAVAGLTVTKVLFVDLSELDALYRIGSVFLLGLVSLLVAWGYHRRAREGA
ncbi:MAG TPA: DUF2339 domain-containing protein [Gemmatimonadales bacterium]|nr:DUF2339 domain-containing protein [Gemmatimonadales bacterium]